MKIPMKRCIAAVLCLAMLTGYCSGWFGERNHVHAEPQVCTDTNLLASYNPGFESYSTIPNWTPAAGSESKVSRTEKPTTYGTYSRYTALIKEGGSITSDPIPVTAGTAYSARAVVMLAKNNKATLSFVFIDKDGNTVDVAANQVNNTKYTYTETRDNALGITFFANKYNNGGATAPATAVAMRITLTSEIGDNYFTDTYVAIAGTGGSGAVTMEGAIANNGFASAEAYRICNWKGFDGMSAADARVADPKNSSNSALKIVDNYNKTDEILTGEANSFTIEGEKIPATAGTVYTASAKILVNSLAGDEAEAVQTGSVYLRFYDTNGALLATTSKSSEDAKDNSNWQTVTTNGIVAPVGTATMQAAVATTKDSVCTAYFDDVAIYAHDADDGDCTSAYTCSGCSLTIEAKAQHAYANDCSTVCSNIGCMETRQAVSAHNYQEDGNCETALICTICQNEILPAQTHTYDNECDASCNNADCTYNRTAPHNYADIYDEVCDGCSQPRQIHTIFEEGFETELSGWSGVGSFVSYNTTDKYSGAASLQIKDESSTAACVISSPKIPAIPGRSYGASAWVKTSGVAAWLYIRFCDADGKEIYIDSDGDGNQNNVLQSGVNSEIKKWQKLTIEPVVAPANAVTAKVYVGTMAGAVGTAKYDDVILYTHTYTDDHNCTTVENCSICNEAATSGKHTLNYNKAVEPGCTTYGSIAYWNCIVCNKKFADAAATTELTSVATAPAHKLAKQEEIPATCSATGTKAHWACTGGCGKKFDAAENGNELADVTLPINPDAHTAPSTNVDCTVGVNCKDCGAVMAQAKAEHSYSAVCDTTCNNQYCTETRTAADHIDVADDGSCLTADYCTACGEVAIPANTHSYDNNCDTTCNNPNCGFVRTAPHTFDDIYDASCNDCTHTRVVHDIITEGFETPLEGWTGVTEAITICTEEKVSGEGSLKFTDVSDKTACVVTSSAFPAIPGKTYSASIMTKGVGLGGWLVIRFFGADGKELYIDQDGDGKATDFVQAATNKDASQQWITLTTSPVKAPENAVYVKVILSTGVGSIGTVWYDDLQFVVHDFTDDKNCNTDDFCTICGEIALKSGHILEYIKAEASTCVTKGHIAHWKCMNCRQAFVKPGGTPLNSITTPLDPNNHDFTGDVCGEIIECKRDGCNEMGPTAHVPDDDDGDCTTKIPCARCGYHEAVAAKEHTFTNTCDTECDNEGCEYIREITHTPFDDKDCATFERCGVCGIQLGEPGQHKYTDEKDYFCDNEGCEYVRTSLAELPAGNIMANYNNSFENGSEYWKLNNAQYGNIYITDAKASLGKYSVVMTDRSNTQGQSAQSTVFLPVTPGKVYQVMADVYTTENVNSSENTVIGGTVALRFLDKDGKEMRDVLGNLIQSYSNTSADSENGWGTVVTTPYTAPEGAVSARIILATASGTVADTWFDAIAFIEVDPAMAGGNSDVGSATPTDSPGWPNVQKISHPGLYFNAEELNDIKAFAANKKINAFGYSGADAYENLIQEAERYLKLTFVETNNRGYKVQYDLVNMPDPDTMPELQAPPPGFVGAFPYLTYYSDHIVSQAKVLSMAYSISGDKRYAEGAIHIATSMAKWQDWAEELYTVTETVKTGLETSKFTVAVANIYDMCYDAMTPAQREDVRTAIIEKGIKPLYQDLSILGNHNIYMVRVGALIEATCAVLDTDNVAEMEQYLTRGYNFIKWYFDWLYTSGNQEGFQYSSGVIDKLCDALNVMKRVTGNADLAEHPVLYIMRDWHVNSMLPGGGTQPGISDTYNNTSWFIKSAQYMNKYMDDPIAGFYLTKAKGGSGSANMDTLLYTALNPKIATEEEVYKTLEHLEVFGYGWLRTGFDAADSVLTMVSNNSQMGHNHFDQNSFVLGTNGQWMASDGGYATLVTSYSDPAYIFNQKYAHNTILVDGKTQSIRGNGELTTVVDTSLHAQLMGSAAPAYGTTNRLPTVNVADRQTMLINHAKNPYYVVFDNLESISEHVYSWNLYTEDWNALEVDGKAVKVGETVTGNTVIVGKGDTNLYAQFISSKPLEIAPYWYAESYGPLLQINAEKAKNQQFMTIINTQSTSSSGYNTMFGDLLDEDEYIYDKKFDKDGITYSSSSPESREILKIVRVTNNCVFFRGFKTGDYMTLPFTVEAAGTYDVNLKLPGSNVYGIYKIYIDGQYCATYDGYVAGQSVIMRNVSLGQQTVTAGEHILKLELVGRNSKSTDTLISVESISFNLGSTGGLGISNVVVAESYDNEQVIGATLNTGKTNDVILFNRTQGSVAAGNVTTDGKQGNVIGILDGKATEGFSVVSGTSLKLGKTDLIKSDAKLTAGIDILTGNCHFNAEADCTVTITAGVKINGVAIDGTAVNYTYANGVVTFAVPAGNHKVVFTLCQHAYSNACDTTCNLCGAVREVGEHVYSSDCDYACDECGATREMNNHTYEDRFDPDCDLCGYVREVPVPKSGKIRTEVLLGAKTPKITLENTTEELFDMLIYRERRKFHRQSNALFSLMVSEISKKISDEDKAKLEALHPASAGMKFLSMDFYKQVDGLDTLRLTKRDTLLKIAVEIPEDMLADGRSYTASRLYRGTAIPLECSYDRTEGVLHIVTDTYSDIVISGHDHTCDNWTIEEDGIHHSGYCTSCNRDVYEEHYWDEGVVKSTANIFRKGVTRFTCKACGAEKDEVTPRTPGLNIVLWVAVPVIVIGLGTTGILLWKKKNKKGKTEAKAEATQE